MGKIKMWRWTFFIVGLIVVSFGITLTIKGQKLGIGPWDVLHVGLFKNFGLSIGTWAIITGLIIVFSTAIFTRQWPKIGTWLNMLLIGVFIDIFNWMLPDVDHLWGQIIYFGFGLVIMGFGAGFYISPNMGAGPRDSLMLIIVDKLGMSIKTVRTSLELLVAVIGWLLGGPVGIGTIIIAFTLGFAVHYSLPYSRKLLMKCIGEVDGPYPFF